MRQHLKTHRYKGLTKAMILNLEPDLRDVFAKELEQWESFPDFNQEDQSNSTQM